MPPPPPADMMRPMSSPYPVDRVAADRQPDLFDDCASAEAGHVQVPINCDTGRAAYRLTDGELIAMNPQANPLNVEMLCAEVLSRSLHEVAPALERLWRRFVAFGVRVPFVEQCAVLSTLGRI